MGSCIWIVALCCWCCGNIVNGEGFNSYSGNGETREYWTQHGHQEIQRIKNIKPNIGVAKNVIFFLGDGMGVSTVTAARILKGQLKGQPGEEESLSFEGFPHMGLSKTYNQDSQTPDSAGTATACLSGLKTNLGIIGLDARSRRGNCSSAAGTEIKGMLQWSREVGKSVGIVTTTRVTHATPASTYAHSPERNWENDNDKTKDNDNDECKDIARQLVEDNHDITVIFGGGREKFLLNNTEDPESGVLTKGRLDEDLIQLWQNKQGENDRSYQYVWNKQQFDNIDVANTDTVLGLFNKGHMEYEIDRDPNNEPSLAEMATKAIQLLRKNSNGFFLLVEGGRIDHAHHQSQAQRSLHDTLAFADAIQTSVDLTSETDTLMIVTADHSHVFTIAGYPSRGNPIFGLADDHKGNNELGLDDKPYTTLLYANGPGSFVDTSPAVRPDLTNEDTEHVSYQQQSGVPLDSETHGGEDVGIYARGPMSHLIHGVHEQNYIAHVMAYASCVGSYASPDSCAMSDVSESSAGNRFTLTLYSFAIMFVFLIS